VFVLAAEQGDEGDEALDGAGARPVLRGPLVGLGIVGDGALSGVAQVSCRAIRLSKAGEDPVATAVPRPLHQSERMDAIGRLAGGVAHDFNNLLGVIVGYVGLALQEPLQDSVRSKLEQTLKAGERAASLTRQLLAFSRKSLLEPTVLDLNALISEEQPMLQRLVREDIELATTLSPRLGTIRADRGQIEQILLNLAANARDAMPEGGRLTIQTANVELAPSYAATHPPLGPGRYVMLALSDTGDGMDTETQAHLFEPFFTTKDLGKGTGLGLATVYGVVKQSDGHISVYSEPGVGTTFKIYLPRLDEEATVEGQPDLAPAVGGPETVLVVEDEAMLREMLRETLERHGHRVLVARDGTEALQIADEETAAIQLLVSDVVMPGFTGLQLAEQLAPTRPEMRFLFISGYTDGASLHRGLPGPGPAFLSKPFSPEALLRKVREVLDGAVRQVPS
jgi:two-component system cell cycle sensor histidine kinase/response regulator CckA